MVHVRKRTSGSSSSSTLKNYRGEGYTRGQDCRLQAHFDEIRAMCDALEWAAQVKQAQAIERLEWLKQNVFDGNHHPDITHNQWLVAVQEAEQLKEQIQSYYGMWIGYGHLLRALEGSLAELSKEEQDALNLIDWYSPRGPHFVFPGREAFPDVQVQPGE